MAQPQPHSGTLTGIGGRDLAVTASCFAGNLVHFGRLLMRLGLSADPARTRMFAQVLAVLGVDRKSDVKAAGRAIFTRRREDRDVYDAAFDLFWRRSAVVGDPSHALPRIRQEQKPEADVDLDEELSSKIQAIDVDTTTLPVGASSREQLRTADFAKMTSTETAEANAMLAALRPRLPRRPARRPLLDRTGRRLATRAMLRRALSSGGEALYWRWHRRATRPRPVVLVCDISGSMERYTRFLLRFAHTLSRAGAPLEVFVFSTRLTRITRQLRARSADRALREVARSVVDWSSGTRIGASLRELNRLWVRRTIRSGAIVLLISDGWERGDPELLAREMATLQRSCHRLVWLDPLASREGFEPATLGLRAALPFVDDFLPCANVASLETLAQHLSTIGTSIIGRSSFVAGKHRIASAR